MKNIPLKNALCIYDEGEIVAIYEVKQTKSDVAKALKDYGYFDDIDEEGDRFFGLNGNCPSR